MQIIVILALSLLLALPSAALAEVVGHLTQVEGRVELLKGGKLPAVAAKAQDGVEPGDVLRTKSLSRAQITFMDNTTVTLSPESRIAIEEYGFDAAKGKRSAVLQLFQGLAHFVVSQVFKVQEPDFLVKTHTGVMGVRGTDVGIRTSPNDTTFLCFKGLVRVGNIFPEVSDTFKKADKTAFAFGNAFVDLKDMQGSVVARGLPPTVGFTITEEDRQLFMRQLHDGPNGRSAGSTNGGEGLAANLPDAVSPALTNRIVAIMNDLTIVPRLATAATTGSAQPPMESFTFAQTFSAGAFSFSSPSGTVGFFSGSLSVGRSILYPGTYTALFTLAATASTAIWPSVGGGTFTVSFNNVSVSGPGGGTFTGTMQVSAFASGSPNTSFTLSGPVTISPGGALSWNPTGTFANGATTGPVTGSWTQH